MGQLPSLSLSDFVKLVQRYFSVHHFNDSHDISSVLIHTTQRYVFFLLIKRTAFFPSAICPLNSLEMILMFYIYQHLLFIIDYSITLNSLAYFIVMVSFFIN